MNTAAAKRLATDAGYEMWFDRSARCGTAGTWIITHPKRDTSYIPAAILREMTVEMFSRAYLEVESIPMNTTRTLVTGHIVSTEYLPGFRQRQMVVERADGSRLAGSILNRRDNPVGGEVSFTAIVDEAAGTYKNPRATS